MAAALRPESRHPRGDEVRLHPPNPRPWDLPPRSRAPLQSRPPQLRPRPQGPLGAARTAPARGPIPARSPALASPIRRRHRERARTHARTSRATSQRPPGPAPRAARTPPRPRVAGGRGCGSAGGAGAGVPAGGMAGGGASPARSAPRRGLLSRSSVSAAFGTLVGLTLRAVGFGEELEVVIYRASALRTRFEAWCEV